MNGWQFLLENEEKLSEINIEQLYRQIAINWCEKNGYTESSKTGGGSPQEQSSLSPYLAILKMTFIML